MYRKSCVRAASALRVLAVLLAALATAGSLLAGDVLWTVNVNMFDGGTLTGTFVWDATAYPSGVMRTWNLTVQGGDTATFPALTYTPANSTFVRAGTAGDPIFIFQLPPVFPNPNPRQLRLGPFSPPPSNSGGSNEIGAFVSDLDNVECFNCVPFRNFVGGSTGTPISDLTVAVSHTGGALYTIVVNNVGLAASADPVQVVSTLPAGVTAVSLSGIGWSCDTATLTCAREDSLDPGAFYPPIDLTVGISAAAISPISISATVSGGGQANTANDTSTDTRTLPSPAGAGYGETGRPSNPAAATTTRVNTTTTMGVNTATGNAYLTFSDLIVPGKGLRFRFIRSYNDQDPYTGPLGRGWTHRYNILLASAPSGAVTIKDWDGHENTFQPGTLGRYGNPPGVYDVLVRTGVNTYTLTRPDNSTVLSFGPVSANPALIRLLSIRDRNSNTQTLAYDVNGNLISFTDVGGGVFQFTYNSANRLTTLRDVTLNRSLFYGYDTGNANLTRYTDATGTASPYSYSAANLLSIVIDARTNTAISNTYDALGRVTRTARNCAACGTGCVTTYVYDDINLITTITDPLGRITLHHYDAAKRLIRIVNALGYQTRFTYDSNNNVLNITNPLGQTTTYSYDVRGNRTSITNPLGHISTFIFDQNSNIARQTDANGHATVFAYDLAGNLLTVTDAIGGVTQYLYAAPNRNRSSFINANGRTTSYTYTGANRLASFTDPAGNITSYTYDSGGRLVQEAEPALNRKSYVYDGLSRVVNVSYVQGTMAAQAGSASFTYDGNGNRLTMADNTGTTRYSYDALNRVTSIVLPTGSTVLYTYDCNDNRTSMTYAGKTVSYTYDAISRMTSVVDGTKITRYTYDAADNLLAVQYPNNAAVLFTYDAASRITQVRNTYPESTGSPASSYSYVLDNVGNRLQITDGSGQVTALTYDRIYRLVRSTAALRTTGYTYDAVGNRLTLTAPSTSVAYTYDPADRLTSAGGTPFVYDANGNQVSKGSGASLVTYAYDSANRLVGVVGVSNTTSTFVYDGDGNRVRQQVGSGTYAYLNDISTDFATVLQETGPDGNIVYTRGRGLVSAEGPGFTLYYHFDAQSTVAALTDAGSNLVQRYMYDVWGQRELAPGPQVGNLNKFAFTGEALDPGTSLYYLRARYYDATLGRFLNKDPLAGFDRTPATLNRFVYTRNNPATLTDRTGRCSPEDAWTECFPDGFEVSWPDAPWWP